MQEFRLPCFVVWIVAFLLGGPALASNVLIVKTDRGKVRGQMSADGQVRTFLGIPYAAPPVGMLRWKPPQPPAKWRGVRPATSFGPHCMQPHLYADMIFRDSGGSEDCLTLNVWTPARKKSANLPVMVWIHGGGLAAGGSSEPRQDGENLARKGVVIVSMNYRLGIFGFFALSQLSAESPVHAAGNYGLMDQTAAFQWVRRNIEKFGGDAANVTIFGESAGSQSVSLQMASPLAQGLFVHAIGESGGAFPRPSRRYRSLAKSEEHCETFAQSTFGSNDVAFLRAIPADKLLAAANRSHDADFRPNIDGSFLPESPSAIYEEGKQAHVPLLAGWNNDEAAEEVLNAPEQPTRETWRTAAEERFGPDAAEFLKAYSASNDTEAVRVAKDFAGDRFIAYETWAWLEAQVKTGEVPVYRYHFDLGSPGDPNHPAAIGAFHSDDIEYVFGTLNSRKGAIWRPEDYKLSELIQNYWTNFARSGNPNAAGLPNWPTYNAADGWQVMHLAPVSEPRPDQHRDRYLFLQKVWGEVKNPAQ